VLPGDLKLRAIGRQLFKAASSVDGRLIRSLRTVVTRPGALTVAYVAGPRMPFMGPFQVFLLANVVFVAAQSLTGINVFSSTLDSHLHTQDWKELAQQLVAARLAASHVTLEAFAPDFNRWVALLAKSLVILMAIPFALLSSVLFVRERRPFGVHVVFAVHLYTFLLLLFTAAVMVAAVDVRLGGAGLESGTVDKIVSVINLSAWFAYLFAATRLVYGAKGAPRLIRSAVLAVAVAVIAMGYRFALFVLALYIA
jgi:hypothetical protein